MSFWDLRVSGYDLGDVNNACLHHELLRVNVNVTAYSTTWVVVKIFKVLLQYKLANHIYIKSLLLNQQHPISEAPGAKYHKKLVKLIMAQHSHVPKFGNWDNDNVPYTAYFENARRGIMMNPNDPMENPEAFNMCIRVGENVDADEVKGPHGNHTRCHLHHRSRESQGSERSHNSDHFVIQKSHQKRSIGKRGKSISSFSSSSHNRHKSSSSSSNDHTVGLKHEAAAIPKFGTWDVSDPKSAEDYSAIFSKIKEEKQITSSHISSISTPTLDKCANIQNRPSFSLSKDSSATNKL
ncbi:hypothetical protein RJT34_14262 [Clitoria ternatea]|uniref:RIN4 pathogenic type III effector avirulence factor Avr cleavage site domain-containing protein n=1 Tax=Clitoria ternatea TaxID=43366 RepID=A0AAN9JSM8_CLITE